MVDDAHVEVGQVAIVDAGPVVLAGADHANQAVCGVFQQIADDPAGAAVDDAGPDDHRPNARRGPRRAPAARGPAATPRAGSD